MVDVTKNNFDEIKIEIKELLSKSSFVSIDLEFTGLFKSKLNFSWYDLPSQRYFKQKNLMKNFLMIQFGICIWKWDYNKQKIIAYPYNFYTFPQYLSDKKSFLSQPSSLSFLRKHSFNFNKLIDGGIDFISIEQEEKERKDRNNYQNEKQQRINHRKKNKITVQPKTKYDVEFMKKIENQIDEFAKKIKINCKIDNFNKDNKPSVMETDDEKKQTKETKQTKEPKEQEQEEEILELGMINRFRRSTCREENIVP